MVTATSPAVGSVLTAPVTDLVVQFNKAFDPSTVQTSDFQLSQGTVVSAMPLTSTVDRPDAFGRHAGRHSSRSPSRPARSLDLGRRQRSPSRGTYIVDIVSAPYPVPLQGKPPAGSLIYDPSVSGSVGFVGDTDTYTLPLAANQTLSLLLTTDPSLIGVVTLLDPSGNTIASATAAGAGRPSFSRPLPIATAGTYSLVVSGSRRHDG